MAEVVVAEFDREIAEELVRHPRCQWALQLQRRSIRFADGDL